MNSVFVQDWLGSLLHVVAASPVFTPLLHYQHWLVDYIMLSLVLLIIIKCLSGELLQSVISTKDNSVAWHEHHLNLSGLIFLLIKTKTVCVCVIPTTSCQSLCAVSSFLSLSEDYQKGLWSVQQLYEADRFARENVLLYKSRCWGSDVELTWRFWDRRRLGWHAGLLGECGISLWTHHAVLSSLNATFVWSHFYFISN